VLITDLEFHNPLNGTQVATRRCKKIVVIAIAANAHCEDDTDVQTLNRSKSGLGTSVPLVGQAAFES
jgi:hypothetical protein